MRYPVAPGLTTPTNMSYTGYNTLERLREGTTTKGNLNSAHLIFVAQQCKLHVWGRYVSTPNKFHP